MDKNILDKNIENDWNNELSIRNSQHKIFRGDCIGCSNISLKTKYIHLKYLFKFINNESIPIFCAEGFLIGIMRHKGFIDFGGINYGSGFDDDCDTWALHSDRDKIKKIFEKSDKFTFVEGSSYKDYCIDDNIDTDIIDYYDKQSWINITEPCHFRIYYDNIILVKGFYIYLDNDYIIYNIGWPQISNLYEKHYKHKVKNYEHRFLKSDIYPLILKPFYDILVPVPNKSIKILKQYYGIDVMNTIYYKIPNKNGGKISKKYNIINQYAPPVDIGVIINNGVI